jgi:glycosyltransferase involved in cell wall biosynthesis
MTKQEKQLRLLVVNDYFYPHWTGIAKSVFSLTQALQDDFVITVLTVHFDRKSPSLEKFGKVSVVRSDYLFTLSRSKYSLTMIWDFLRLIRNSDYVFINSPCANIIPFSLITKLFGKKLLIFHHGDLNLPKSFLNKLIEKLFDLSSFISFSLADKVSTHTSDYGENSRVIRPFLKKFTPVLMPVSLQGGKNGEKELSEIEKLKKEKKIIFGFAGRFVEEKGFDILFRAIPLVMKQVPNAHFVVAGQEMSYENFFSKNQTAFAKVKNQLTFLGLLNDIQLQEFYRAIECIVLPSRSDCFPLVQAEAMQCGTPAIASDIPGLRYLVKKSGFGVLFRKNDEADLAEKIVEFVHDKADIMKSESKAKEILDYKKNVEKAREFITS